MTDDKVYANCNVFIVSWILKNQYQKKSNEPLVWKMFESDDDVIGQSQSKLVIASTSFSQPTKTRN